MEFKEEATDEAQNIFETFSSSSSCSPSPKVDMDDHFFSSNNEVSDSHMMNDVQLNLSLQNFDPEEERMKRLRFIDHNEEMVMALGKDEAQSNRTDLFSSSPPSDTDSWLLERARELLRGSKGKRKRHYIRHKNLTFDIDEAGNDWKNLPPSSPY